MKQARISESKIALHHTNSMTTPEPKGTARSLWRTSRLALLGLLASAVACHSPAMYDFPIQEHVFTIDSLPESLAREIDSSLQDEGIEVAVRARPKGTIKGERIGDFQFLIKNQSYYTGDEFLKLVNRLRQERGENPIILNRTTIAQEYSSAAAQGEAHILLSLKLSPGARAFYKDTGEEISFDGALKNGLARFHYPREKDEEYVDIFVLPAGASNRFTPSEFQRISLHAPFNTTTKPWKSSWYKGIMP